VHWRALAFAFAGGILAAAAGWFLLSPRDDVQRSAAELMDVVMWNREPIGGPFALIDHNGQRRTDSDFRGKLLLIYFGFTFCSDVCPVDLQSIASALNRLGTTGEAIQPLFITVDPEKDTPEQLKGYVALFHPRLVGLTGDARQIRQVARAYKVYYARTEPTRKGGSDIDHMGVTFLVGADGKYIGYLPPGSSAERIIEAVRPQLAAQS
jgi:protein SCO1/2